MSLEGDTSRIEPIERYHRRLQKVNQKTGQFGGYVQVSSTTTHYLDESRCGKVPTDQVILAELISRRRDVACCHGGTRVFASIVIDESS